MPEKEFDASLGTAAAYQRNLEVYMFEAFPIRSFKAKKSHSKEISQHRNLTAKASRSEVS
jgi:hypothetical protein